MPSRLSGIQPGRLETVLRMSPEVAAGIETLTAMVARELAGLGIALQPRPAGEPAVPSFPAAGPFPPAANLP